MEQVIKLLSELHKMSESKISLILIGIALLIILLLILKN